MSTADKSPREPEPSIYRIGENVPWVVPWSGETGFALALSPRFKDQASDWAAFDTAMAANAARLDATGGEGFRLLVGQSTSPTLARRLAVMNARWPKARWHVFEPVDETPRLEAARAAFGRPLSQLPHLERAEVVSSEKVGRVRTYQLVADTFVPVHRWIAAQRRPQEERLDRLGDYLTQAEGD